MSKVSLQDQISCLKRELNRRTRVYPDAVQRRRMTIDQVTREMAELNAAIATLEMVQQALPEADELLGGGVPVVG